MVVFKFAQTVKMSCQLNCTTLILLDSIFCKNGLTINETGCIFSFCICDSFSIKREIFSVIKLHLFRLQPI
jgi:hypothetical protein